MASISWKAVVSGDWSAAADWNSGTVPGVSDTVTIATSGNYTVTVSLPEAASSIDLTASGAVLQVSAKLSISGSFDASRGTVSVASGQVLSLTGPVSFGLNGSYGATIDGPGGVTTSGATSLVAQTGGDYQDLYLGDGATWANSGTVINGGLISFGVKANDTAAFVNQASGVFNLTTDNADITANASGDTATFSNAGTLKKTGGTGTSTIAAALTNTGTVSVSSGTLALSGGGTLGGTLTTSGFGMLALAGGSFTVGGGALATAALLVDGATATISSAATMSGGLTETSGTLAVAASSSESAATTISRGTVSVASGLVLSLTGPVSFGLNGSYGATIDGPGGVTTSGATSLVAQTDGDYQDLYLGDGATWTNSGTVTDGGLISFGVKANDTAAFVNQASGVFNLTTDNAGINADASGDTATFNNAGTLKKTGGTGISTIAAALTNTGTVSVGSGTLALSGGGTLGGTLATNGSGMLALAGGSFTATGGALATAALLVDGATATISSAATMSGGLTETSGTLAVAASSSESAATTISRGTVSVASGQVLSLTGPVSFGLNGSYGATIDGPGGITTSGATTLVAQTDGDYQDLYLGDGATWTNSGTVTDGGLISFGVKANDTAAFVNQASGVFDLSTDKAGITANASGDTATFSNAGTLKKTAGTGTSTIAAALTNTGTVSVSSGTLNLAGPVANTGVLQALAGASLDVSGTLAGPGSVAIGAGGTVELGSATSQSVVFTGAGTLRLDAPSGFTGTIYGFNPSAKIVLGGAQVSGIVLRGTSLTVNLANGGSYSLNIAGLQSTNGISFSGNTLTGTGTLQSTPPELVVSAASAPAKALAGEPVTVTWTDTNIGSASASGPWTDQVYLASNPAGDNAQLLGSVQVNGPLPGSQMVNQSLNVTLPAATSGTEYLLVKADALNQVPNDVGGPSRQDNTAAVTIIPTAVPAIPPSITSITPNSGSNLGDVTVTIDGSAFKADDQVAVVGTNGTVLNATQVDYVTGGELWATFNLTGLPIGSYHIRVSDPAGSAFSPGSFTINSNPAGQLSVNLVLPSTTQGTGTGTVTYTNTGGADIAAPILDVSSSQALLKDSNDTTASSDIKFLGTNPNGPAGILQPGASGSYSFTYTPTQPTATGDVSIALSTTQAGAPIDWSSLEAQLRPSTVDPTDWNNVYTEFVARVGTTTDSLTAALDQDATELSQVGQPTNDVATLLQYELFQASGALAGSDLDDTTDISRTSSSLSLSLARTYDGTLLDRDAPAAFGDGWTSNYDMTAVTDASGDVYIQTPTALHVFTVQANGSYAAQTGDPATLTLAGGLFQMNDGSGDISQFNAAGRLASFRDASSNVVSLTYGSNGVPQTVTGETTGETITFMSNAAGRITSATDSDGRQVTYTYDTTGTQLLSATSAAGITTYSYVAPTGSVQDNALTSVTNPNGTVETFTYDAEGRLASQSGNGGVDPATYSYPGAGKVTVTDALGSAPTLLYGADGTVAQTQDALGNATRLTSNAAGELTGATTAGGSTYRYAYDSAGNLTSYTDPLGGTINASYAPGTQNLTDFTDQRGGQTHYSYDAAGNVTGINYQDSSGDTYQYSAAGLLTSSTDADGNTTTYRYDSAGNLTSKTFSDGTSDTYAYDAQGNLIAATVSGEGTTTYTYDAASQLTGVINPQGQVESYTYNALGELATRTEPDGSVTQYSYDALGRLTELQDGSGNLLDKYTYNASGELARTDTGNGAYTTYQYDADGNVTEILDSNADGTVADRMDYTYNADGQVIENATSDGLWTYGYDKSGELTSAVFQSINPAIQNQNLSYVYDAAGNRVSQTVNGVVTDYTTNALNQYTAVGGTTYTYDADGNTTSETDGSGTTTFTYNEAGELTSENGPGGTYQYAYDALGGLVSETKNGVLLNYIDDPLSLSLSGQPLTSIAQIDSSTGADQDTFDYGLGLAAITDAAGDTSYFDADLNGDVVALSGANGQRSSSYFYLPSGQVTQTSGTVTEPFQFAGEIGFATTGAGLVNMRARFYVPSLGRFLVEDPSGASGGSNFYSYVDNDPVGDVDPTGKYPGDDQLSEQELIDSPTIDISNDRVYPPGYPGLSEPSQEELDQFYSPFEMAVLYGSVALVAVLAVATGVAEVGAIGEGAVAFSEILQSRLATAVVASLIRFLPEEMALPPEFTELSVGLLNEEYSIGITVVELGSLVAAVFGDPHLSTFDGLNYNFQTAGEFALVRQTSAGNFDVQARISALNHYSTFSEITELGIQVGLDRVTIDATRSDAVWVDGVAATFTNGVVALAAGQITENGNRILVRLDTGESVNARILTRGIQDGPDTTSKGIYATITLNPFVETPGSIDGLLGDANGDPTKDLTLADGTVLPTNMPTSELYGAYADSWRVTQATSLLDYGPGQTTDSFTDRTFPGQYINISSFPQSAVQAATAVVQQMGITDPGLQQDAIYDYLVTGDSTYVISDGNQQQEGVTTAALASPTLPAPPAEVGIIAAQISETEAASGPTTVQFQFYRSGDTAAAATVSYAVTAPDSTYVGAASFGGTLPSGTVSFTAGQTEADLAITLTGGIGNVPSAALQVQLSAPSPIDVIGQAAQVKIVNPAPVAGPPPAFAVELTSNESLQPTIAGNTWTFDLGPPGSNPVELAVDNTAAEGADQLSGTVTATGSGAFTTSVTASFSDLVPGAILNVVQLLPASSNPAAGTETLTFTLQDTNSSGYTVALPTQTVILSAGASQSALATLSTTTVDFGSVRAGTILQQAIGVTNSGQTGAEDLDVSIGPVTGAAIGSGAFTLLAPGQTSDAVTVGLATTQSGVQSGSVTIDLTSDGTGVDGAGVTPLASQSVQVTGRVYDEAQQSLSLPDVLTLHVGDSGSVPLTISNGAGDVENLLADVTGVTGGVTAPLGTLGEIAAGGTAKLPLNVATASAGIVTGTVELADASDGAGTDGAPITSIGTQTVDVTATVDNYAALGLAASAGQLSFDGTEYVLNLGTIALGSAPAFATLSVSNSAPGPADLLSGTVNILGNNGLSNQGAGAYEGLASGASADVETVGLDTGTAGTFSETLDLDSTGSNASGYSGALADQRVLVTGTVAAVGATIGNGPDDLMLDVSEDAYLGDAQYTVSVDGQQIGGMQTATASRGAGQSQVLNVVGTFGAMPHEVTVNFLNDAYANSASTDRNLYVTGASYDGTALPNPDLALFTSGPESFGFGGVVPTVTIGTGPDVLALSMSEDEYQGDAEFTVSVDGQQIGGVQATNASHAAVQSEVLDVLGTFGAGQHVVVVDFINDDYSTPFNPAMDRNLYVDSATIDGTPIANADLVLDSGGPQTFSFGQPPATITVGTGPDTLALAMSEDAYRGDAEFTVSVDGAQVGGLLSTAASHAMGQSQALDVMGSFATGPHTVSVYFVNDGFSTPFSPTSDRNLYVDNATINGTTIANSTLALFSGGPQSFSFGGPAAPITIGAGTDTLTFLLSEDAYLGDAQFTVSVDGSQIGGVLSASASHAAGQDQILNVLGTFAAGAHTVSLDFLNDLYAGTPATDRNLYMDGATINGNAVANSNLALYPAGPRRFTFTEQHAALQVMPV